MKLTPAWRNRLRNLTTIFLVLTMVAIIYTLIQWIRSEPGSFEPLNVLFFAVFSVASAISAWLSRPDNVQPPASSEIALAETPALGPLRQQITNLFSLEELRVLCLDVGIRYDALSGDTIDTKAASLLAYADRRGQLNKLIAALQQERPQAKWPIPNTLQTLYDLRRNVRATWIEGVLKQSVTDEISLELNLTLEPHALTRKVAYVPGLAEKPIVKDVSQLFADFGSLLILGEPGSGKTMTLLQLAESLFNDAEYDATLLTPVVLNLSSWANEQKPLVEWLVEELWQQYQLPRESGREIIQSNQLIYLLDGLDEVAEVSREGCVKTINLFVEQHNGGLVVCCRVEEYESLSHKLNLGMGVRILPLDKMQVVNYFQRPELALKVVYKLWQTDESLQNLAQTPLFLSVITITYRNLDQRALRQQLNTETTWQAHLYRHYVAEMFNRRPLQKSEPYEVDQALAWLTHLAYGMRQHEQALFFLERLQPSWLPAIPQFHPLLIYLFFKLSKLIDENNTIKLYEKLSWSPPTQNFFEEITRERFSGLISVLIIGLLVGLIFWLSVGFSVGLSVGLIYWLIGSVIVVLPAFIQISQQSFIPQPNRAIHDSLQSGVWMTLVYGLIIGLIVGLIVGFSVGLPFGLLVGLISGAIVGLIGGFLQFGGQSFLKHYVLRWLLARNKIFPFKITTDREFIDFLDAMKDRILLRRVGGGWMFIHRTLLEYFAALHPNAQVEVDHE